MTKNDFLNKLQEGLKGLPQYDIEERLAFYSEMIEDMKDDGIAEEVAVSQVGSVEEIAEQIIADTPLPKIVKERLKPKRKMKAWEIVLLILGFPIWFPLLVVAAVLLLCVYAVIWVLAACMWVVELCIALSALLLVGVGIKMIATGELIQGLFIICSGAICGGITILLFIVFKAATKGAAILTKKMALWIKSLFIKKEND